MEEKDMQPMQPEGSSLTGRRIKDGARTPVAGRRSSSFRRTRNFRQNRKFRKIKDFREQKTGKKKTCNPDGEDSGILSLR